MAPPLCRPLCSCPKQSSVHPVMEDVCVISSKAKGKYIVGHIAQNSNSNNYKLQQPAIESNTIQVVCDVTTFLVRYTLSINQVRFKLKCHLSLIHVDRNCNPKTHIMDHICEYVYLYVYTYMYLCVLLGN